MVVLVDLDDDKHGSYADLRAADGFVCPRELQQPLNAVDRPATQDEIVERANPNINGFSAALSCYPVVFELARQLDLNDLDSLSRTCRQFRANMLEFRDQLVKHSLHCVFENVEEGAMGPGKGPSAFARPGAPRLLRGKVSKCARDMVAPCQRCGMVVCRNCTTKPPPTPALKGRHRRLCRACSKAPLYLLTGGSYSRLATSPQEFVHPPPEFCEPSNEAFTASAFTRTPCVCETKVWLCQPCGQKLRTEDISYQRAWTFRTRYTYYHGGVGTGAGEGNEGVPCGRGPSCLAAKLVEQEVECDPEKYAELVDEAHRIEAEGTGRSWKGSSYLVQEIEGVGGLVTHKVKKHVPVGAVVKIYRDEEDRTMSVLEKEVSGKLRSWCSWCQRVIRCKKDLEEGESEPSSEDDRRSSKSSSSYSFR